MNTRLKHYKEYLDRIERYAEAHGITIRYTDTGEEGSYSVHRRIVNVDDDMTEQSTIATMLHEIGHGLDFLIVTKGMSSALNKAYLACYDEKADVMQLHLVVEAETKAWNHAEAVAKILRIRLGKWFYKERNECLKLYKKIG